MELDMTKLHIRPARIDEWDTAMALAWKTFQKFEAADYSPEGVRNFEDFVTDQVLKRMFITGQYCLFCAFYDNHMVGMISVREQSHLSLLFVEERFHYNGVGRRLVEQVKRYLKDELGKSWMTVNASPYAVGFYHRLGFVDLRAAETKDGITYTPMINRF